MLGFWQIWYLQLARWIKIQTHLLYQHVLLYNLLIKPQGGNRVSLKVIDLSNRDLKAEIPSASLFSPYCAILKLSLRTKLTLHAFCNVLCSSNRTTVNIKNGQNSNYMCTASCINVNVFIYLKKIVCSSGQHFCAELQRDIGFLFMAPERLCWAEDHSVADGWLCCVSEWNGWGALIRQPPTHIAGMLIALWGAVWQQAMWHLLGISRWGYIHTVHIFLQSPH